MVERGKRTAGREEKPKIGYQSRVLTLKTATPKRQRGR